MFGYVNANKPELKLREYDEYRALYCGLCKELGKEFGVPAKLTLSFDFTFLALLGSALSGEPLAIQKTFCLLHPFQKRGFYTNRYVKYSAFAAQILTYAKLRDDLSDEKGLKKIRAFLSMLLFSASYRKASRSYPALSDCVKASLSALSLAEKAGDKTLDAYADYFATIMRETFAAVSDNPSEALILSEIGYHTGRWIYILDAFDDLSGDAEKNRFNPLFLHYSKNVNESALDFRQRIMFDIEITLTDSLVRIAKAYALLPVKRFNGQLENIIYTGMPLRQKSVLNRKEKK